MGDEEPSLSSEQSDEHKFFRRLEELYGNPLPTVAELRRALEKLYGGSLPEPQTPPTPRWISLSVKSEYQKLCEELGGPVEGVAPRISQSTFERCCDEYDPARILPELLPFAKDAASARRHWPLAAFAIDQYVFEIEERKTYIDDEPTPANIEKLLKQIAQAANELTAGLCRLQTLAERLKDPTAPNRRGHLGWLDAFISQATAGVGSNEVNEIPEYRLLVDQGKLEFIKRLAQVQGTTIRAIDRMDRTLLERERGQSNPALSNFVLRCGSIWTSLTGKDPTAERVVRKEGSEDPQFVLFMQRLARVAEAPEPNRNEVALCLKRRRT